MINETLIKNGYDMIYLATCALHGRSPEPQAVSEMDLQAVYDLSVRHSMEAITCMALERYIADHAEEPISDRALVNEWKAAKAKAIRKIVLFDIEREKLTSFMEDKGIWYMPLKGVIYQHLYPKLGMRQITDNDILFDENYRKELRDYMVENGYQVYLYGKTNHDIYMKAPVYNFEMHVSLIPESRGDAWYNYYRSVKDRLIKDDDNEYGYHFSDEDFYIYGTAHAFKHFSTGGNGIRSLMDIYVCMSKCGDRLDRDYLDQELEQLNVKVFEDHVRPIAQKLFAPECILPNRIGGLFTEQEREVIAYCLSSGSFGTRKIHIGNQLNELSGKENITAGTKIKYLMRRIFPRLVVIKSYYPFCYKTKVLIPFAWLHRLFRGFVLKFKETWAEFKLLRNIK